MADQIQLAEWLQKDFQVKGKNVIPKKKYGAKYQGKGLEIEDDKLWVLANKKRGTELVVSCTPIMKHTGCLWLMDQYKIDLSSVDFTHETISTNHYIVVARETNKANPIFNVPIIGEAHKDNVQVSMSGYMVTMAYKRCIDRVILQVTGLYQQGFYSESEMGGDFIKKENNKGSDDKSPIPTLINIPEALELVNSVEELTLLKEEIKAQKMWTPENEKLLKLKYRELQG